MEHEQKQKSLTPTPPPSWLVKPSLTSRDSWEYVATATPSSTDIRLDLRGKERPAALGYFLPVALAFTVAVAPAQSLSERPSYKPLDLGAALSKNIGLGGPAAPYPMHLTVSNTVAGGTVAANPARDFSTQRHHF